MLDGQVVWVSRKADTKPLQFYGTIDRRRTINRIAVSMVQKYLPNVLIADYEAVTAALPPECAPAPAPQPCVAAMRRCRAPPPRGRAACSRLLPAPIPTAVEGEAGGGTAPATPALTAVCTTTARSYCIDGEHWGCPWIAWNGRFREPYQCRSLGNIVFSNILANLICNEH